MAHVSLRILLLGTMLVLAAPAAAQSVASDPTIPKGKGAARIVGLFNFLCLKQLPDLEGVERAAGFGEYDQLTGRDLAPYVPDEPNERLLGWRYHDHGEAFVLTAMRVKADAAMAKEAPGFDTAEGAACTLFAPAAYDDAIQAELMRVMGRAPDRSRHEGSVTVSSWLHQQAGAMSRIDFRRAAGPAAASTLSARVFVKN